MTATSPQTLLGFTASIQFERSVDIKTIYNYNYILTKRGRMNIHIINFYAEVCFDLVPNDLGARAGVVFFATDVLLNGVFWVPSVLE